MLHVRRPVTILANHHFFDPMPDHRAAIRLPRPPIRQKRTAPPGAAYQLLTGKASFAAEENAWESLRLPTREIADRYGADRFDLLISIRNIVQRLEKLASVQRWQQGFFSVSIDAKGNRYLDVRPPGILMFELFTKAACSRLLTVMEHFPGCDLHPYFQILLDALRSRPSFEIDGWHYEVEKIADEYFFEQSRQRFFNHTRIYQIRDDLNYFFAGFYQSIRNSREKAKSFRRTPLDNRRSLMQFACHLLDGESQTVIAHLTIRRDIKVIGGDPPISRSKSEELRKKLVKHIKREIPDSDYLGHAILLKRDAILGCWMETFVFFTKNALVQDADVLAKLVNRWNGEIGLGRAGCVGEILFQAHSGADKRYSQTLERIVLVTEPNFYCRVSAEGLHRFWCTQSPVGKLAERTRQNKRRETEKKRAAKAPSSPVSRLQEAALANRELMLDPRWVQARERHGAKIAERRKKAAKTRSRRKGSQNITASAPVPTYMTAVRFARIDAANDESNNPSYDVGGSPMNSREPARRTDAQQNQSPAPASNSSSRGDKPAAPHRPIQLERQPGKPKEHDTNREHVKVEVRKKRTYVSKPED
ncbi:hypothetical protein LFL96_06250 [Paraburkholderia sp. D15]|uniref:hypothetical protein n=1 Tax=Paraburkholderia sp. D15 TaxID=2880218 RepID=UPI00247B17C4|nr:hypothetical protein [Paraburkholderia sp. D15]WGS51101.1 hypothetical protein LFL96_06250 [Paraburkholderia sp. D15]